MQNWLMDFHLEGNDSFDIMENFPKFLPEAYMGIALQFLVYF